MARACRTEQGRPLRVFGRPLAPDQAWVELLDRLGPWDWFVTVTWPQPKGRPAIGPELRASHWRTWIAQLAKRRDGLGLGRGWHRSPARPRWALGWEPHRSGAMHGHALVAAPLLRSVHRLTWKERWHRLVGGIARVYEPHEGAAALAYVTKYVSKGGELELSENVGTVQERATQHRLSSSSQRAEAPSCGSRRPTAVRAESDGPPVQLR